MGLPDEQKCEDDKTLDEQSEEEELSESSESTDLSNDTKEDSNKNIKKHFRWPKSEPPVVDSTFHGKAFRGLSLTELYPYIYFKQKHFLVHLLQNYTHTSTSNNVLMMS